MASPKEDLSRVLCDWRGRKNPEVRPEVLLLSQMGLFGQYSYYLMLVSWFVNTFKPTLEVVSVRKEILRRIRVETETSSVEGRVRPEHAEESSGRNTNVGRKGLWCSVDDDKGSVTMLVSGRERITYLVGVECEVPKEKLPLTFDKTRLSFLPRKEETLSWLLLVTKCQI